MEFEESSEFPFKQDRLSSTMRDIIKMTLFTWVFGISIWIICFVLSSKTVDLVHDDMETIKDLIRKASQQQ